MENKNYYNLTKYEKRLIDKILILQLAIKDIKLTFYFFKKKLFYFLI